MTSSRIAKARSDQEDVDDGPRFDPDDAHFHRGSMASASDSGAGRRRRLLKPCYSIVAQCGARNLRAPGWRRREPARFAFDTRPACTSRTGACSSCTGGCASSTRSPSTSPTNSPAAESASQKCSILLPLSSLVCEEIAPHRHHVVRDREVTTQETQEEHHHLGIRVREPDGISISRSSSPEQHAAGHESRIAAPSEHAALGLITQTASMGFLCSGLTPIDSRARGRVSCRQALELQRCQFDVANPATRRTPRNMQEGRDLLDRHPLLRPELAGLEPLGCFHF